MPQLPSRRLPVDHDRRVPSYCQVVLHILLVRRLFHAVKPKAKFLVPYLGNIVDLWHWDVVPARQPCRLGGTV